MHRVRRRASWAKKTALGLPRDILVEIRWRLGDEIMAIPIYEALHRAHPGTRIYVLCNHPELLEDNPYVAGVNRAPAEIDRYILLRHASRDRNRLEHYAETADIPVPEARPTLTYRDWDCEHAHRLPRESMLIAVSAGATWPTKRWPTKFWRRLCVDLEVMGCGLVELGTEEDEAIGEGVLLVGQTSVREAARILRTARLYVGCDSGLMHLALAVGTPVVALFGPTDPAILVRPDPNLYVVTNGRECQGCWNGEQAMLEPGVCPLGVSECLGTIEPKAVLARVRSALNDSD
jgi:ADP-heptose:LPS heptosyltransferase